MLVFIISCFLGFFFYVSKSYQGNDMCLDIAFFFLFLFIYYAEHCQIVFVYQGQEIAGP